MKIVLQFKYSWDHYKACCVAISHMTNEINFLFRLNYCSREHVRKTLGGCCLTKYIYWYVIYITIMGWPLQGALKHRTESILSHPRHHISDQIFLVVSLNVFVLLGVTVWLCAMVCIITCSRPYQYLVHCHPCQHWQHADIALVSQCHHTPIHWSRLTQEQVPHIGASDLRMSRNNAHQSYHTFVSLNIFSEI